MYGQFLILVFWLNLHTLTAYRNGQVTQACMSMTPGHEFNASTLEPPYTVISDASNYTDGQVITVTLQGNATVFRGFLLQARDEKGPVGTFTVMENNTQLLSCGTNDSAVSHTSNVDKSTIKVQWKAPNSNNTDIWFRATFVQNFSIFWVGVQSDPVRFLATNPPNVTVAPPNGTVSPPNATVSPPNGTVFPTNATVFPTNGTIFPTNGTVFPTNGTIFPTNGTVFPTNVTVSTPNRTTNDSPSISLTWCLFLLPLLAIIQKTGQNP